VCLKNRSPRLVLVRPVLPPPGFFLLYASSWLDLAPDKKSTPQLVVFFFTVWLYLLSQVLFVPLIFSPFLFALFATPGSPSIPRFFF